MISEESYNLRDDLTIVCDKYIQLVQICLNEHLVDNISIQSFGISRSVELIRKQNRETTNFSVLF